MTDPMIAFALFFAWAAGAFIGKSLEALRWRRNASDYKRIESGGRLFKVYEHSDLTAHVFGMIRIVHDESLQPRDRLQRVAARIHKFLEQPHD